MNHTRLLLTLAACFAITACGTTDQTTNERPISQEGEFCGGIAAFECAEGLICVYDGNYPDAGGTCEVED